MDTKKMKRNRMQRERKLERDDETLATVCLRPRNRKRVRFVGRSQGREEGEGNKGRIWDEIWCGAQEERKRETELYSLEDALGFFLFFLVFI